MFAKTIIDSDAFLDMPLSTQALYFHLSMRADDEGFINNPKKIQRMIGASDDDLKVLASKNFIIPFESGIVVIKHWRIHNYIRADRLVNTKYTDERKALMVKENGSYSICSDIKEIECLSASDKRKKAYEISSLPYSFSYKMKRAFEGHICPMCGAKMTSAYKTTMPTIQHNIPISKGGVHELENISIICESCNTSTRDKETGSLNNADVIDMWDRITSAERQKINWFDNPDVLKSIDVSQVTDICQSSDRQWTDNGQAMDGIGKDRIGKDNINKNNNEHPEDAQKTDSEIFEYLWSIYPNKKGKKQAHEAFKRAIKKGATTDQIRDGIKAYKRYIKECGIEPKYIKQGSTFFKQEAWNDDWTPNRPKDKNNFNNFEHNEYDDWDALEKEIVENA